MDKLITADHTHLLKNIDFEKKYNSFLIFLKDKSLILYNDLTSATDVYLSIDNTFLLKDLLELFLQKWIDRNFNIQTKPSDTINILKHAIDKLSLINPLHTEGFHFANIYKHISSSENGLYIYDITMENSHERETLILVNDYVGNSKKAFEPRDQIELSILTILEEKGFVKKEQDSFIPTFKSKYINWLS